MTCRRSTKLRRPVRRSRTTRWPRPATRSLATGLPTVADDSGLEVAALNGMPGVLSARWSGRHGDDAGNTALLLAQLRDVPDERRGAAFVSACALVSRCRRGRGSRRVARRDRPRAARRRRVRLRPGIRSRRRRWHGLPRNSARQRKTPYRTAVVRWPCCCRRCVSLPAKRIGLLTTGKFALTSLVWRCSTMIPSSGIVPASSTPMVLPIGQRTLMARLNAANT